MIYQIRFSALLLSRCLDIVINQTGSCAWRHLSRCRQNDNGMSDSDGKIKIGRKKMIKEYISTPQALALAVMVFTLGLKTPVRDETALNVITILWFISAVVLWALM